MIVSADFGSTNTFAKYKSALLQMVCASLFIAFLSQVRIFLPFTPIPLTLQTLAVLLVGATLGSKKAVGAVLFYYAQILIGLPVLNGRTINPLVLLGPSGGYVIGFVAQAYVMGWFAERISDNQSPKLFWAGILACALQLVLGALQLSFFVEGELALFMGIYPFLPGEILKVLGVCYYLKHRKV